MFTKLLKPKGIMRHNSGSAKEKKNQFQKESRIQTDHLSSLVTAKLKSPV